MSNIGYINFLQDGSIPSVFNPSTFKASSIQTDNITTSNLSVSNTSTTNGIIDLSVINASALVVSDSAVYSGIPTNNSNSIATTQYVDTKISNLLGSNVNTLMDTISEINTALNNDPNYANTIATRLGTDEVNIQTNTNNINTINSNISSINTSLLNHDTRITNNASDIHDIQTNLTTINASITTNTNNIATNTNNINTNTNNINTLTTGLNSANSNITSNTNSIISLESNKVNISDILTRTLNDRSDIHIASTNYVDLSLDAIKNGVSSNYDTLSELETQISTKANDASVLHIANINENIDGVKTFLQIPKIGLNNIATTNNINDAIANLINSAPSTMDTLGEIATILTTDTNNINTILSTMTTLSGAQTIDGLKTFTTSPIVPSLTQGDNSTKSANTSYVDTGLNNLNTSISTNYLTTSSASSTYQPLSSMSSYLTASTASSTYQPLSSMSSYLTTSTASSTYQPISSMSSYLTTGFTSSNNTFTGSNEFQKDIITNKNVEKYIAGTVSSNAFTIDYSTNTNNIYLISPSSGTNIALTITNLPTTRGTAIYDFSFLINVSTYKNYINSLNINGSSITMIAINGLTNITINSSSSLVLQNLNIVMNGATVSYSITSVASIF